MAKRVALLDVPALGSSWALSPRADRTSPQTLKTYTDGLRLHLAWCAAPDAAPRARQPEEVGRRPPRQRSAAGHGPRPTARCPTVHRMARREGRDPRRPVRRSGYCAPGEGRRGSRRPVRAADGTRDQPLPATAQRGASDSGHRLARSSPSLWLGDRGKDFSDDALHKTLAQRADTAGIAGFHPHLMRHTAAHRWLSVGGFEGACWLWRAGPRPDMLMRYTRAQGSSRAADEARGLNLGEL